ncbi:Fis family PAS modulated sigma54 specific transcriptional regulator [Neobacillus bataviensis LMG 21833]|uniref:Fis family PAS modulated sigma54 specific transcriptional regulator n=1 Tax=Neobacillus bataviensis LMG 21833 TaxID=1117379 RepID=K6DZ24_9BACI|nr:sigma-54-dependent Fis family transcriptional regulator [Neobacillus bataviensis]EKN66131.1 Fis family PAS modulated sigma54 specific transcriptional regulator [Neobacillus bataviensis LMG 21833]
MLHFKDIITPVDFKVTEETTLKEAITLMHQKKWSLLPVTDASGQPVGVFTRSSLQQMVLEETPLPTSIKNYIKRQVEKISVNTPYEKIEELVKESKVGTGVVVDQQNRVVGILTKTDMVMSLLHTSQELQLIKKLKRTLETAIDHAFDGIVMTDEKKVITMVSPPLLELYNLSEDAVLNKQATSVLPQLELEKVYESETAEVSGFLEINGIKYIVHRIPILEDGKVIGALGKVVFRQLNEVSELFNKLQKAENKANFYHQQYQKSETARYTWEHIFSTDPFMEKLKKSGAKAAKGRSTVLIRGESGTGKELFAHAIHHSSARSSGKFVVVNCAAIPEDLLESEFFGYEEGAFTGAKQKGKLGKFDLANGGTLFLDEIGDMSLTLQAKLLRVLQEREFYRVGGNAKIKVDVRIIAATNRNLEEMVKESLFREDLYYRLNVISLHIPPLRDRPCDIDHLISRFMIEFNQILGTSITGIEDQAKEVMFNYEWPGNVRELRNVMERAMTFSEDGKIKYEDLPDYLIKLIPVKESALHVSMVENAELEAIKKALVQVHGNKVQAARLLGISRSGLYEKIKKYKLPT